MSNDEKTSDLREGCDTDMDPEQRVRELIADLGGISGEICPNRESYAVLFQSTMFSTLKPPPQHGNDGEFELIPFPIPQVKTNNS